MVSDYIEQNGMTVNISAFFALTPRGGGCFPPSFPPP
jgi:hypothetical protein